MKKMRINRNQRGVTLVELVITMVIISIAVAGVMTVINSTILHSADPVLRQQAIAIAEAYMEEITLKNYLDPDDDQLCPGAEANRKLFDNICDYNGLNNNGARSQSDPSTVIVPNYTVTVVVASENFGPTAPAGVQVAGLKINVTVTDPAGESLTLSGYRTDY
ncbi:MAG: prepilin-type N-terminal cleavage/methylation domain-containing protein [Deltaproteobacteria bacterium]|nr:prepilin-type N-terminal cleavage/methylation domain-containing protein [Deltaproteobacteria bacterium]NCP77795.1 prepilin-type N-terminal cleavage/methylation domain-containing protein [Desulfuromonadales bacterium]